MKLRYKIQTMEMDGRQVGVPLGKSKDEDFHGVLLMNAITGDMLDLLKKDTTEDALVAGMLAQYDTDEATMRRSVKKVLDKLEERHLLDCRE